MLPSEMAPPTLTPLLPVLWLPLVSPVLSHTASNYGRGRTPVRTVLCYSPVVGTFRWMGLWVGGATEKCCSVCEAALPCTVYNK